MENNIARPNLENLTLKEFEELLSFIDLNEAGENLYVRMWNGGGCYILDDAGNTTEEFETIYNLVEYLQNMKDRYQSGELKVIERN